jgi:hypothetical protein
VPPFLFQLYGRRHCCGSTGVDTSILRQLGATHTFDKLLGIPEIMRFIDKDPALAQAFRNPVKFT